MYGLIITDIEEAPFLRSENWRSLGCYLRIKRHN